MRTQAIILISAVTFGLAGGYAWSVMNAPAARMAAPPTAATVPLPASPEERPAALDTEWETRTGDEPRRTSAPIARPAQDPPVHYAGCNAVRAAGKAPLHAGQPGYSVKMDGDRDGIACEPHRAN